MYSDLIAKRVLFVGHYSSTGSECTIRH